MVWGPGFRVLGFKAFELGMILKTIELNASTTTGRNTHRLHSISFLGLPYRILNTNHKIRRNYYGAYG